MFPGSEIDMEAATGANGVFNGNKKKAAHREDTHLHSRLFSQRISDRTLTPNKVFAMCLLSQWHVMMALARHEVSV